MKKVVLLSAIALLLLPVFAHAAINLNLEYPSFGGFDLNERQNLNEVVAWFYYLIVGTSGFAAFTMLIWGGITWLSSAGSPAGIADAKDRIRSALLGLLLVLSSFIILQVLNPELTIFRSPELTVANIPDTVRLPGGGSGTAANTASCDANQFPSSWVSGYPLASPVEGVVTSPFGIDEALYQSGARSSPCHTGIDIAGNKGKTIYAPASGVIEYVGTDGGYGSSVIIDHGTYKTRYAHMSFFFVSRLQPNISRGDRIGIVGNSGAVTGSGGGYHLHYEIISKSSSLQQNTNVPVWGVCDSQTCANGFSVTPVQ